MYTDSYGRSNSAGRSKLKEVAESLRKGDSSPAVTVRQLLAWFGQHRRGWRVVATIKGALRHAGLSTEPDFATAYIDGRLRFALSQPKEATPEVGDDQRRKAKTEHQSKQEEAGASETLIDDPVLRVRMLPAANRPPVTVNRDDSVERALCLMAMHDYSQLPVAQSAHHVDGMVSWRSILLARIKGGAPERVGECMERHEEVRADDPLLTAFRKIVDHEAVLVRATDRSMVGIVTSTDLSTMFREQTEPFLLLSEIENQLRRLINGRFSREELAAAKDPDDEERDVDGVTDLTFGECTRLLERPEHWERLGLGLERKTFVVELGEVRRIRNDVMHFDPDGLSADDLQRLKNVRRLLQRVL